jgi:hypothetical protein
MHYVTFCRMTRNGATATERFVVRMSRNYENNFRHWASLQRFSIKQTDSYFVVRGGPNRTTAKPKDAYQRRPDLRIPLKSSF